METTDKLKAEIIETEIRIEQLKDEIPELQAKLGELRYAIKKAYEEEEKHFKPYAAIWQNSLLIIRNIHEDAWLRQSEGKVVKLANTISGRDILNELNPPGDKTMERVRKLYAFVVARKDNPVTDYFQHVTSAIQRYFPEAGRKENDKS